MVTSKIAVNVEVKRALCQMCSQFCGVEVHVKDGEVVKIIGDKKSHSKGFRCEKNILGAIDYLNHPDRLNYPLKRSGARGQNKWERISWQTALDEIAGKLGEIREDHGPEAVVCMVGTGTTRYHSTEMRWCNLLALPTAIFRP